MTDQSTDEQPAATHDDKMSLLAKAVTGLVIGYAILVAGIVIAIIGVRSESDDRADSDRDILLAFTIKTCVDRNQTKDALRETINAGIEGGGVGDLSKVPGFEDLDAATQIFFRNLATLSEDESGKTSTERLRAYRDSLVDENCDKAADDLRTELEKENGA